MTRARTLMAAVPQRVWMAVAALVVLASVGVSLVLGAGLSTWRGEVGQSAVGDLPGRPTIVVSPPRSAVIVVPTPGGQGPAPAVGGGSTSVPGGGATTTTTTTTQTTTQTVPALPHTAPGAAAGKPPAGSTTPTVAHPRATSPTGTSSSAGPSCTAAASAPHRRGHAYGLYKKAARALQAQGCGPLTYAAPARGKAATKAHGHAKAHGYAKAHGQAKAHGYAKAQSPAPVYGPATALDSGKGHGRNHG